MANPPACLRPLSFDSPEIMQESESTSAVNEQSPSIGVGAGDSAAGAGVSPPQSAADAAEFPIASSLSWLRVGILWLILGAGVVVAAKPTYDWWHARQSQYYREACETSATAESWTHLEAIASQWVEWDAEASEGWIHLADALLKQNELQGVADALAHVDNSYPGVLGILEVRGDFLFSDLNQPYAAEENWRRMLDINDRADVARQRLIYFYAITMQRERMREEILRAMEAKSDPLESYAYLLLAYEVTFSDGLSLTRKWRESYPEDETLEVAAAVYLAKFAPDNTIYVLGISSVAEGDETEVTRLFDTYPQNLEILAFHLEKAVFEGNEPRVVEILGMCPPSAELDCRFWRGRGWLLSAQGRHEDAAQALQKCVELNPLDWRGRLLLSGALRQLGRNEEASRESDLQLIGKELQEELFTRPNARSIDLELAQRIYHYTLQTGPAIVPESLARWIEGGNLDESLPDAAN